MAILCMQGNGALVKPARAVADTGQYTEALTQAEMCQFAGCS